MIKAALPSPDTYHLSLVAYHYEENHHLDVRVVRRRAPVCGHRFGAEAAGASGGHRHVRRVPREDRRARARTPPRAAGHADLRPARGGRADGRRAGGHEEGAGARLRAVRQPAPARDVRRALRSHARRRPARDAHSLARRAAARREDGRQVGLDRARAHLALLELRPAGLPERALDVSRPQAAPFGLARSDARRALEARPVGRAALPPARRAGPQARREPDARRAALAAPRARALLAGHRAATARLAAAAARHGLPLLRP